MSMKHLFFALLLGGFGLSCTKQISDDRPNPFQAGEDSIPVTYDLRKLEGLHAQIFSQKCANPTCHDGSFEPDFRTVQSTYYSLVYHPVVKNNSSQSFEFRVIPGNANDSWLYERLIADEQLGRMPLYAEPLPPAELEAIRNWIENGAGDIYDQTQNAPNRAPLIHGYGIFDSSFTKVDTVRVNGWASAFLIQANQRESFVLSVEDEKDANTFSSSNLSFGYDPDQWQPFRTVPLQRLFARVMTADFDASTFPTDTTIYMRVEITDEAGARTEIPNNNSPIWWKRNFSFRVLP